jgi:NAD(P)-dependent dehydrogenase (short-subunit alcohol dehydrogenase family)
MIARQIRHGKFA